MLVHMPVGCQVLWLIPCSANPELFLSVLHCFALCNQAATSGKTGFWLPESNIYVYMKVLRNTYIRNHIGCKHGFNETNQFVQLVICPTFPMCTAATWWFEVSGEFCGPDRYFFNSWHVHLQLHTWQVFIISLVLFVHLVRAQNCDNRMITGV